MERSSLTLTVARTYLIQYSALFIFCIEPDAYCLGRVFRFFQLQKELYEKVNAKKNVEFEG